MSMEDTESDSINKHFTFPHGFLGKKEDVSTYTYQVINIFESQKEIYEQK